jgi:hypothetical protein
VSDAEAVERRLVVGAVLGMVLAAYGILRTSEGAVGRVPADAVAVVDGRPLPRADYERRLTALANDRRARLDAGERRRVLERLIDEELLFGRALELELPSRDATARKDLIRGVVDAIVANAPADAPTEAELRALYDADRGFFAPEARLRVRSLWFRVVDPLETAAAEARAGMALEALRAGEPVDAVAARRADGEPRAIPGVPLPLAKLVEYLGPSAARAAGELEAGNVSEPIRTATGIRLVLLVERSLPTRVRFEDLRPRVLAEWRRRHDERALEAVLADLRGTARIEIAPDAISATP